MVRHWQGYNFAKCNNFSSSSLVHSVFLMLGSSHSYHLALHCLADFLFNKEATLAHWFLPYFMTAAFKISSSVFFHTPPLIMIRMVVDGAGARGRPVQFLGGVCGGAARRAARRALGAAQSSAARPARLGHLLRYCSAAAAERALRRAPALRGWQSCARLSKSSNVRCVAFTAPRRVFAVLASGLTAR